jgi:hypothetical protein
MQDDPECDSLRRQSATNCVRVDVLARQFAKPFVV